MGPQKELILNEGEVAFYNGTLRYKNPYSDPESIEWWFLGYDAAEEKHNLFVDNKRLLLENEELSKKNKSLNCHIVELSSEQSTELNDLEKQIRTLTSSLIKSKEIVGDLVEEINDKNESIKKLISWIDSKKTLLFISREKLIADLKKILK